MTTNLVSRYVTISIVLALAIVCIYANWPISLGIDLRGGSILTYKVEQLGSATEQQDHVIRERDVDDTVAVISQRINNEGVKDIAVRREGNDLIVIQLPEFTDEQTLLIRKKMTQVGQLLLPIEATDGDEAYGRPFKKEQFDKEREEALRAGKPYSPPKGFRWFPVRPEPGPKESEAAYTKRLQEYNEKRKTDLASVEGVWMYFDPVYWDEDAMEKPGFTGRDIENPRRSFDGEGGKAVTYDVRDDKQVLLADYTTKYKGRVMPLVLNEEVWARPSIAGRLYDNVQIFRGGGGYTDTEQDWLLNCLKSGSLKLKPVLQSQEEIGATLGQTAIERGEIAFIFGALLVILFMVLYYRTSGIMAVIALTLNFILVFAVLMLLDASLTLPGIAGLVLTVGMAVDANILIFERIREELEKGKKLAHAAKNGFDRAFITIFDANLTTFIVAAFLVAYGKGPIKGFGYTMMTGIVCSMFAALYIVRTLLGTAIARGWVTDLKMMQLMSRSSINFLGMTRKALVLSGLLVVMGLGLFLGTGSDKYGLDFNGGTSVRMHYNEPMGASDVRKLLAGIKNEAGKQKYANIEAVLVKPQDGRSAFADVKLDYIAPTKASGDEDGEDEFRIVQQELQDAFAGRLVPMPWSVEPTFDGATGQWTGTINFAQPITDEARIIALLAAANLKNPSVEALDETGHQWKLEGQINADMEEQVQEGLFAAIADDEEISVSNPFPKLRFLGPNVVADLKSSAIQAIIVSLLFILAYIWFRFKELKYGFAAAMALVHDVLVALGITIALNMSSLVNVPISLNVIAAFLTIIGYSLNDTIVLFDRIRENLGNTKGTFREIVNRSINQTLSRTILTSLTTFAVVACVFVANFGLESPLEGLSFTLLVGVVVGTYSSIFVASPVLIWLHRRDLTKAGKTEEAPKAKTATA